MSNIIKQIRENLLLIVAIGTVISLSTGAVGYFAKASELKLVAMRLDQKILADRAQQIQEEIWRIKREYGEHPKDRKTQERIERLEMKKQDIERELDKVGK